MKLESTWMLQFCSYQIGKVQIIEILKKSISAVESVCKVVTGEKTLGKALNNLEKLGIKIHPSMKSAFDKLYVYTNDSKTGIRHAKINAGYSLNFDEAKFMLVICSSFINYLKFKS